MISSPGGRRSISSRDWTKVNVYLFAVALLIVLSGSRFFGGVPDPVTSVVVIGLSVLVLWSAGLLVLSVVTGPKA